MAITLKDLERAVTERLGGKPHNKMVDREEKLKAIIAASVADQAAARDAAALTPEMIGYGRVPSGGHGFADRIAQERGLGYGQPRAPLAPAGDRLRSLVSQIEGQQGVASSALPNIEDPRQILEAQAAGDAAAMLDDPTLTASLAPVPTGGTTSPLTEAADGTPELTFEKVIDLVNQRRNPYPTGAEMDPRVTGVMTGNLPSLFGRREGDINFLEAVTSEDPEVANRAVLAAGKPGAQEEWKGRSFSQKLFNTDRNEITRVTNAFLAENAERKRKGLPPRAPTNREVEYFDAILPGGTGEALDYLYQSDKEDPVMKRLRATQEFEKAEQKETQEFGRLIGVTRPAMHRTAYSSKDGNLANTEFSRSTVAERLGEDVAADIDMLISEPDTVGGIEDTKEIIRAYERALNNAISKGKKGRSAREEAVKMARRELGGITKAIEDAYYTSKKLMRRESY